MSVHIGGAHRCLDNLSIHALCRAIKLGAQLCVPLTLEKQLQQLTTTGRPARDVIADCSTHALLEDRRIDRHPWRDALVGCIAEQPEHERLPLYQSACRRIRTTYRAAPRDRQGLICALARAVKPTL